MWSDNENVMLTRQLAKKPKRISQVFGRKNQQQQQQKRIVHRSTYTVANNNSYKYCLQTIGIVLATNAYKYLFITYNCIFSVCSCSVICLASFAPVVCHLRIYHFPCVLLRYRFFQYRFFSSHLVRCIRFCSSTQTQSPVRFLLFIFIWCVASAVIIRCIIRIHCMWVELEAEKPRMPTGLCWSYAILLSLAQHWMFHRIRSKKRVFSHHHWQFQSVKPTECIEH